MLELDNIYNMDCLEGMKQIPDGTIDAVICDLPYGTMKGVDSRGGWKSGTTEWDDTIPTDQLFAEYGRILRRNGACILFSQEPYTSHLRTFKGTWLKFCYPMIWEKEHPGNIMSAKKVPMNYFEDINVFKRRGNNDADKAHPLREYSRQMLAYMGKTCKDVQNDLVSWGIPYPTRVAHFLTTEGLQFSLCTEETYNILIERYGIDKWKDFRTWQSLKDEEQPFLDDGRWTFNLPQGKQSMSNIFVVNKDTDGFHPTQKPVALIRRLVLTYTNEGDTVLDNCMGSGTTAIACIKERRHFIGFELSKEYFDKAVRRIKAEQAQLTLF